MARLDHHDDDEDRAGLDDGAVPPRRLRLKLKTCDDVAAELARLYREGKTGRRDVAECSRLANILQILGRMIEGSQLERRLEALEAAQQQDRERWPARH